MSGYVYFLRPVGAASPVKIGFSKLPKNRIRNIGYSSPVGLINEITVCADRKTEGDIHRLFSRERQHGEWFSRTDRLSRFIDALKSGALVHSLISEWAGSRRSHSVGAPEEFVRDVEDFLRRHADEWTPTTFGMAAISDPNFVFDLWGQNTQKRKREPRYATVDRVRAFMREESKKKKRRAA